MIKWKKYMRMGKISKVRWGVSILKWKCNSAGKSEWSYRKCRESRRFTGIIYSEVEEEAQSGTVVVITKSKRKWENVKMSKEKSSQRLFGWIIKVFKAIKETLSKVVSNERKGWEKKTWKKEEPY